MGEPVTHEAVGAGGGDDPPAGLIDWDTALDLAARLMRVGRGGQGLASLVAEARGAAPVFQNKDHPLSPLPLVVDGASAARTARTLEAYVRLLEKAVRIYRQDPEVRRWYGLGHAADALIDGEAEAGRDSRILVCRLDGYLQQGSEKLRVLENNADAPAGTLFTPRVHSVVAAILERAGVELPPHADDVAPDGAALLDVLTAALSDAGRLPGTPCVAVLQPRGKENRESREMAALFRTLDVDALIVDPHELTASGGHAWAGRRRVDVCWNKINTVSWDRMVSDDPELLKRWLGLLRETDLVHVNSFAARYVAESKLTLALLQEEEFAHHFDDDDRNLTTGLLPWTRRLRTDTRRVLDEQHRYVIKEPYDIRGDGVTVGRAVSHSAWSEVVARAGRQPAIVQEYVAPSAYPTVRTDGVPRVVAMPFSLDAYVLRGRTAFFGSKASLRERVNVFQGGQKLAVHVTSAARDGEESA
ncbi:circularly permuted type 2 ATP-grasp protein [Streptomyces sp. CB03238]|uniref:circularly permuted type 2 ATP-grasp protein n=1 Tax=Streptomyces sp. CB03238 TaxID=1907777 RepID=UPI000A107BA3|nr:circularly permuted type 2 ATP-grasp protein [Streptomyces sp. CB03238]ORT58567.1 hypothetical protein BKD26_18410 [Streptomyces sp. CB03238]